MTSTMETTQLVATAQNLSGRRPMIHTMPGMIYEASKVLDWAMDPNCGGLHPELFGKGLKGIAFISIVEAGFVFSGNVGTGIVLARRPDGSWSAPSAIGVTGVGYGFIIGASMRHLVYLIYNEHTIKSLSGNVGITLGTKMEAALGSWGRSAELTSMITNKGLGSDIWLHYSQGLFSGFSVEGALCNPRSRVNEKFYGRKVSPSEILFDDTVQIPDGTLLPAVYAKLNALCNRKPIHMIKLYVAANDQHCSSVDSVGIVANEEEDMVETRVANEKETPNLARIHATSSTSTNSDQTKVESIRVFGEDSTEKINFDEEIQHAVFLEEIRRYATEEASVSVVFLDNLAAGPSDAFGTERGSSIVSSPAA